MFRLFLKVFPVNIFCCWHNQGHFLPPHCRLAQTFICQTCHNARPLYCDYRIQSTQPCRVSLLWAAGLCRFCRWRGDYFLPSFHCCGGRRVLWAASLMLTRRCGRAGVCGLRLPLGAHANWRRRPFPAFRPSGYASHSWSLQLILKLSIRAS